MAHDEITALHLVAFLRFQLQISFERLIDLLDRRPVLVVHQSLLTRPAPRLLGVPEHTLGLGCAHPIAWLPSRPSVSSVTHPETVRFDVGQGRSLSFDRFGAGRTIICHPGGPGFPGRHLGTLGGVDSEFELVVLNPRGTGESDPPVDGLYSLDAYASDLDAVRDHLGLDRISVYGHSHGGFVAVRYAATYADRVSSLILDGTPLRVADVAFPSTGTAGYFATWDDRARAYVAEELASPWEEAGRYFVEHEAASLDLTSELARVTVPCLFIVGEADFATGPSLAHHMAGLTAQGRVAAIPGAGHFAWVEAPTEYAATIGAFLASIGYE